MLDPELPFLRAQNAQQDRQISTLRQQVLQLTAMLVEVHHVLQETATAVVAGGGSFTDCLPAAPHQHHWALVPSTLAAQVHSTQKRVAALLDKKPQDHPTLTAIPSHSHSSSTSLGRPAMATHVHSTTATPRGAAPSVASPAALAKSAHQAARRIQSVSARLADLWLHQLRGRVKEALDEIDLAFAAFDEAPNEDNLFLFLSSYRDAKADVLRLLRRPSSASPAAAQGDSERRNDEAAGEISDSNDDDDDDGGPRAGRHGALPPPPSPFVGATGGGSGGPPDKVEALIAEMIMDEMRTVMVVVSTSTERAMGSQPPPLTGSEAASSAPPTTVAGAGLSTAAFFQHRTGGGGGGRPSSASTVPTLTFPGGSSSTATTTAASHVTPSDERMGGAEYATADHNSVASSSQLSNVKPSLVATHHAAGRPTVYGEVNGPRGRGTPRRTQLTSTFAFGADNDVPFAEGRGSSADDATRRRAASVPVTIARGGPHAAAAAGGGGAPMSQREGTQVRDILFTPTTVSPTIPSEKGFSSASPPKKGGTSGAAVTPAAAAGRATTGSLPVYHDPSAGSGQQSPAVGSRRAFVPAPSRAAPYATAADWAPPPMRSGGHSSGATTPSILGMASQRLGAAGAAIPSSNTLTNAQAEKMTALKRSLQSLEMQLSSIATSGGTGSEAKCFALNKKLQRIRADILREYREMGGGGGH